MRDENDNGVISGHSYLIGLNNEQKTWVTKGQCSENEFQMQTKRIGAFLLGFINSECDKSIKNKTEILHFLEESLETYPEHEGQRLYHFLLIHTRTEWLSAFGKLNKMGIGWDYEKNREEALAYAYEILNGLKPKIPETYDREDYVQDLIIETDKRLKNFQPGTMIDLGFYLKRMASFDKNNLVNKHISYVNQYTDPVSTTEDGEKVSILDEEEDENADVERNYVRGENFKEMLQLVAQLINCFSQLDGATREANLKKMCFTEHIINIAKESEIKVENEADCRHAVSLEYLLYFAENSVRMKNQSFMEFLANIVFRTEAELEISDNPEKRIDFKRLEGKLAWLPAKVPIGFECKIHNNVLNPTQINRMRSSYTEDVYKILGRMR